MYVPASLKSCIKTPPGVLRLSPFLIIMPPFDSISLVLLNKSRATSTPTISTIPIISWVLGSLSLAASSSPNKFALSSSPKKNYNIENTGKSFSEVLILASTNPQYDKYT